MFLTIEYIKDPLPAASVAVWTRDDGLVERFQGPPGLILAKACQRYPAIVGVEIPEAFYFPMGTYSTPLEVAYAYWRAMHLAATRPAHRPIVESLKALADQATQHPYTMRLTVELEHGRYITIVHLAPINIIGGEPLIMRGNLGQPVRNAFARFNIKDVLTPHGASTAEGADCLRSDALEALLSLTNQLRSQHGHAPLSPSDL
jgi:hypothetical protein